MAPRPAGLSSGGLGVAARRLLPPVLLGVVPLLSLVIAIAIYSGNGTAALDFHHEIYPEAKLVAHGDNPYPPPDADLSDGTNYIWPVAAVLPFVPLTVLSPGVADAVMTMIVLACLVATLWILRVRDWRVYGVSLLWPPVISSYQTANLTLVLCLLVALAWRYRGRSLVSGTLVGVTLALKFFLWPLVLWLAARRWYASSALATGIAAASLLLILPFTSLGDYVELIRNLSSTFEDKSYTVFALLVDLGAPDGVARTAAFAVGAAILLLAWRRRSLGLAIGAALVLSPIVWLHFFALLLVPLAIRRPRFDAAWLLALPLWLVPGTENGSPWQTGLALIVAGSILVASETQGKPLRAVRTTRARAQGASIV